MKLNVKKLDERAIIPTYGTEYSAGADLYVILDGAIEIPAHTTEMLHTGIAVEIPEGYCGLVFARSSMGAKRGLAPANKVGVIDADYRGEIRVALHNHTDTPARIEPGERVAQLAIVPFLHAEFEEADELSETVRGIGGFGSTGR
ncbi:MAG: dUTP diphosphatase [Clostridia bacterium]|nr:dUTP diphosphatase [Clostridia bacterium]